MTNRSLEYRLNDGFIHNWLVAGPVSHPVAEAAGRIRQSGFPLEQSPVDRGKFDDTRSWYYYRSSDDHLVDVSAYASHPQYLQAWAYTRLAVPAAGIASFNLLSSGQVEVWVNGQQAYQGEPLEGQTLRASFNADLQSENEVLVSIGKDGVRSVPLFFSLQLEGMPVESIVVQVPVQARFPQRFQNFERMFDHAYLEEAASYRGRVVKLRFADDTSDELRYAYSIRDADSMIYVEGTWDVEKEQGLDVGHPQRIFERPAWVVLRAPNKEYFEQNMRYQRALPIYILDNNFSESPYGSYYSRRAEALEDAARRDGLLFAEMAKMVLEKWQQLDRKAIQAAIRQVQGREAGSEMALVGLLGMKMRFSQKPEFPQDLLEGLDEAAKQYAFSSGAAGSGVDFEHEGSSLVAASAEILAGQLYPNEVFAVSSQVGAWHRAQGEAKALEWLKQHGERGFAEWDSPQAIELIVVGLTHLISLAENETIREFAAVLLDKVLFLMAVNTYKGIVGGSAGSAGAVHESSGLKTARLQPSAGIARLLWGTGIYTAQLAGVISLALSDYEFPSFFADIATRPVEMWNRERHQAAGGEVNKVTYRTPDYVLGSAQDYCPGQAGSAEHIWQATLGPDALVFTNHPAVFSQEEHSRPGFWLGNGALPRVAQWKDTLVAVYNIPEDALLGFTHAFFPVYAFDEYAIEGGWAFGRKGDGFVAITASQGFELVKHAPDGYRELRSQGRRNVWVCQMGRVETDGNFHQFREKVLASQVDWSDMKVRCQSLRGDDITFGWEGPLTVNGSEVQLSGFPHIDNPYCQAEYPAGQMDIHFDDAILRLSFE